MEVYSHERLAEFEVANTTDVQIYTFIGNLRITSVSDETLHSITTQLKTFREDSRLRILMTPFIA